MESVNDWLMSESLRHQVALAKYSNATVMRIIKILNEADGRMFAELTRRLARMDFATYSAERLESMLSSVRVLNTEAYAAAQMELSQELREFVAYEVDYQRGVLLSVLPVEVSVATVTAEQAYVAATAKPFQGVLLRQVWPELDASKMRKVRQAIAQGYVENKTTDQIIRELRGTKAAKYADGIIQTTRRDAEAVVRTALSHMAGVAQDAVAEANNDLIKAVKWSSTLDLRTSEQCRIRDARLYTATTHKPIGHKIPWLAGPGRLHWRCRSAQVIMLKSYKELGIDVPEVVISGKTRASLDGQIPAEVSYADWLKKQSKERQGEVLGATRAKLMRDGKLTLDSMYSQNGQYLSLAELREKDANAFKRAGL